MHGRTPGMGGSRMGFHQDPHLSFDSIVQGAWAVVERAGNPGDRTQPAATLITDSALEAQAPGAPRNCHISEDLLLCTNLMPLRGRQLQKLSLRILATAK